MAGFNHTLSAILRGAWLIDSQWATQHIPMVVGLLNGNVWATTINNTVERKAYEGMERPFAVDARTMRRYEMSDPDLPYNSVGILPINGPITKYSGDCGEPGAIDHTTRLINFKKDPRIGSVVLLLDTPGGEARAANDFVNTVGAIGKPVLSYVDGMTASLGVWYSSACKEVYLSNELDNIGSVGSYVTLFDFRGHLEQLGIKMHEIYAPQSTDKNESYRDALEGNYDAIKKDLELHVDSFISFVKQGRGDRAAANEKAWSSGKLFHAKEGIKYGLADGVASFDRVVAKAAWLGLRNK